MSGSIIASSGRISTFSLTSGSIDSDTSNAKRGIKLKPGEAIRGYGNTVHTTVSTPGKFSFGAAQAIAPANNAPVTFQTDRVDAVGVSPL